MVEQQLIWNWAKLGTELEQKIQGNERPKRRREPFKILPKSLPGGSPRPLEQRKITCDPTVRQKVAKVGRTSAQRGQSGARVGPQNRPKSGPDPKKRSPRWRRKRFSSISWIISVRSHIPGRFWKGLNLQNCAPTTAGARFSQNHRFHDLLEF